MSEKYLCTIFSQVAFRLLKNNCNCRTEVWPCLFFLKVVSRLFISLIVRKVEVLNDLYLTDLWDLKSQVDFENRSTSIYSFPSYLLRSVQTNCESAETSGKNRNFSNFCSNLAALCNSHCNLCQLLTRL